MDGRIKGGVGVGTSRNLEEEEVLQAVFPVEVRLRLLVK